MSNTLTSPPADVQNRKPVRASAADLAEAIQGVTDLLVELQWAEIAVGAVPALEAKLADFRLGS